LKEKERGSTRVARRGCSKALERLMDANFLAINTNINTFVGQKINPLSFIETKLSFAVIQIWSTFITCGFVLDYKILKFLY